MKESLDLGPVELSYAAALRGIRPRVPGAPFVYVRFNVTDVREMLCLAASNPEGLFHFLTEGEQEAVDARDLAEQMVVRNVTFTCGQPSDLLSRLKDGKIMLQKFDYLCMDDVALPLAADQRTALFALAESMLTAQGVLAYRYRPFVKQDDSLRYLIGAFAPLLSDAQKTEFLQELRQLGSRYFARSATGRSLLERALSNNDPDLLLKEASGGGLSSGTMETMRELLPHQMMYVGDATIAHNYLELTTPESAHAMLQKMQGTLFYEPVKDFVTDRGVRSDIWCRLTADVTNNPVVLYNSFFFGTCDRNAEIPKQVTPNGRRYDLSDPLFAKLITLLRTMPMTIGDFLHHSDGKGYAPADVIAALQLMTALGFISPMRATYDGHNVADYENPQLSGQFNQSHWQQVIGFADQLVASTVTGRALRFTTKEALVLHAVTRAGFSGSAHVLLPELQRLANDPAQSMAVLGGQMPDEDVAAAMINDICERELVGWYALGVLGA